MFFDWFSGYDFSGVGGQDESGGRIYHVFVLVPEEGPVAHKLGEVRLDVGGNSVVVQDDFQATHFFVAEHMVIGIVEEEDAQAVRLESALRCQLEFGRSIAGRA